MKVLVAIGKTSITVDTKWTSQEQLKFIEDTLKALCYTVNGVDYGSQWGQFRKLIMCCASALKRQIEQKEAKE